jgi:DNA polymerase III psi subunit
MVLKSQTWFLDDSREAAPPHDISSTGAAAAAVGGESAAAAALAVAGEPSKPLVSERLADVCTSVEASLRAATAAVQRGENINPKLVGVCLRGLLGGFDAAVLSRPPLMMHMGLRGPEALALEQRQLYSMISTVQKLSRCQTLHGLCWGAQAADECCLAAAQAAVGVLSAAAATATAAGSSAATATPEAGQQGAASAAALQHPEVDCLPSLVILGRLCLTGAQQLHQQTPMLLQMRVASAVRVLQQDETQQLVSQLQQLQHMKSMAATVSFWVVGVTSSLASAALAAAASGGVQQFRQQLEALSAAQQAVRDGVSDASLSDASLTALVQQLQATGLMLSSVAVPHFCNDAGCVNISGPTDVQLVSGRSCMCAGCCTARYCGRGCQRQAWPKHKPVCKALAAAAAT